MFSVAGSARRRGLPGAGRARAPTWSRNTVRLNPRMKASGHVPSVASATQTGECWGRVFQIAGAWLIRPRGSRRGAQATTRPARAQRGLQHRIEWRSQRSSCLQPKAAAEGQDTCPPPAGPYEKLRCHHASPEHHRFLCRPHASRSTAPLPTAMRQDRPPRVRSTVHFELSGRLKTSNSPPS